MARLNACFGLILSAVLVACASSAPTPSPPASGNASSPSATAEPTSGTPTTTSAATPTVTSTAPATAGAFPATMLGMPVMTVAAAGAALEAGQLDGRFAAIGGYWRQYALPCPFPAHEAIIEGFCSGAKFGDTAADVDDTSGGFGDGSAPVAVPETLNDDQLWQAGPQTAARVVLIVHALDSRSWQCTPDQLADCQRHMVIDDVAWVNGSATPLGISSTDNQLATESTFDQVAANATKSGEQLVTAYALPATALNTVDPRLMGQGGGIVWLVRTASAVASGDDTASGNVRLVSDADAAVVAELPLDVAADYNPARLILDSDYSGANSDQYPQVRVLDGGSAIAEDRLDLGTTPVALQPGSYTLHAYLADQNGTAVNGATCDKTITLAAGSNLAYKASFSGSTCSWAPFDSDF